MAVPVLGSDGVLLFALHFWRPHVNIILLAAFFVLLSTGLSICIPQLAREVATFNGGNSTEAVQGDWFLSSVSIPAPASLVGRCVAMAAVVVAYHATSFLGHKSAYTAGLRIHNTILEIVLVAVLATPHLDRIALVSPAKLSQIILSSAKTSADVVGALLTDVLSSLCATVFLLGMLLHMSVKLTVTIVLMLASSQLALRQLHRHNQNCKKELSLAESDVQALATNALQRSATIRVFNAESVILGGLEKRLQRLHEVNLDVITVIHGQAGLSSAVMGLLFVLVLGATNTYRQRGELDMIDIAMYYMLLFQFINRLQGIQHDCHRTHVLLESLGSLRQLLTWYDVEHVVWKRLADCSCRRSPPITVKVSSTQLKKELAAAEGTGTGIELDGVTYVYPEVPAFLLDPSEAKAKEKRADSMNGIHSHVLMPPPSAASNGVHDVNLTIPAGSITAIYGPSGSGKSTCLRLLAGLIQPHKGQVKTHAKLALLEQEQAILFGSIADNILMVDTSRLSRQERAKARDEVNTAMRRSGCDRYVKSPFQTLIHSPDKAQFSGGQLQRICMARLYARTECTLLLLDEPTTGLDAKSVETLIETLKVLNSVHKKTIVFATHDKRLQKMAHRTIDISLEEKKTIAT
ncbi:ABC transporter-like protein [Trypanosoma conorhini]|uniref:ABC transporter-like protein n=1 Tax=Trypanosoma conorhini TaxID=83891 RepID=A0A3R7NUK0_9TRYP|nr:ABC transporter-like protein [Trypanosoma conorhini]RNF27284.1 ABC transporter-like protein [Trypanosoma conorhini]